MREVTQTITYSPEREAEGIYGNCLQAAVAGAGTLAQLKTAIAALPSLAGITAAQVRTAIRNAIDADA